MTPTAANGPRLVSHDGLRINLLGRANLVYKSRPLAFRGPDGALALLGYLLLHRDRELTRDSVAFTLWPDLPESAARGRLRKCLYLLLTAGLPQEYPEPWVLSNKRYIRWNPKAPAQIDLDEFERWSSDKATYAQAVALYRGDLMSDLDEEWLLAPRATLRARFLVLLTDSIDESQKASDHAATSRYARRALEIDPWREDALRALMSALQASGDRTGAVRTYREFAQSLKNEMELEPSAETATLFQGIVAQTASTEHPLPQSSVGRNDNLPSNITVFVGRERELDTLRDLLSSHRLITLTGVGGIGKSRLALETMRPLIGAWRDGIWLIELASLVDPQNVGTRIGSIVDVRERAGESMLDTLSVALRSQEILLILDNCEHLIDSVAVVVDRLLKECPNVRVLATSREPLRIAGELVQSVESLETPQESDRPPTLSDLSQAPATRLFLIRAADHDKTLRSSQLDEAGRCALAAIARRLDGIPLAIELAAASTDLFTLQQLEQKLDHRLELLTGGSRTAPARHQTLRATLDWSYGMLSETEQRVFERLGVFRGGWSLDAATYVCQDSTIGTFAVQHAVAGLLEKSLVYATTRGVSRRYNMLETMRLYTLERLSLRGEIDAIYLRHAQWCLAATEEANGTWIRPEAGRCTRLLASELDNILQALHWSFESQNESIAVRLAHSARVALSIVSLTEMSRWAELALSILPQGSAPEIHGDLLWDLAAIRYHQFGDVSDWLGSWKEALAIYQSLPDRRREALALARLVEIYHSMRADDDAQEVANAALDLANNLGDSATLGYALVGKAFALPNYEIEERRSLISRAIAHLETSGEEAYCARASALLAEIEFESGHVDLALQNATIAINKFENMGLPHFSHESQTNIPMYLNALNRFRDALRTACGLLPNQIKYGQATSTLWTLLHIAVAAAHLGQTENAARLLAFCQFTLRSREIAVWQTDAREAAQLTEFLRTQLDGETLAALIVEGEIMKDTDAVALALSLPNRCLPPSEPPTIKAALVH